MSSPIKSPSPTQPVPQNTPMAPPATPTTRGSTAAKTSSSPPQHDTGPSTPGSHRKPNGLPSTPNRATPLASPRPACTPGGTLLSICKSDPTLMTVVQVHTARCTECDQRNKDTMLRCPGCTFQICKPCRERREKQGRSLVHGNMMSPGGLGGGLGSGLGSGRKVTRRVVGSLGSPTPTPMPKVAKRKGIEEVEIDEQKNLVMAGAQEKGKGKGKKPASKKRAKGEKVLFVEEESSDDDFRPDPTSPTSHKRRRITLAITDTPTATSTRPSRTAPTSSTYIEPHSSSSSTEPEASTSHGPSNLNSVQLKQTWGMEAENVAAPTGRVQELLEAQGVNTAENRYENNFLARHEPVMTNWVIEIPESVKRMAEPKRMGAVEKREARVKGMLRQQQEVHEHVEAATARGKAEFETAKYYSDDMHADEYDGLSNATKEVARKWANTTHDALPLALQTTVAPGLDVRLDHIDEAYTAQLIKEIEQCAIRKLDEFAAARVSQGRA